MSISKHDSDPGQAGTWKGKQQAGMQGILVEHFLGKLGDRTTGHLWGGELSGSPHSGVDGADVMTGHVCGDILALVSPPAIQAGQTRENNVLRDFQCAACRHGNPFPIIPAGQGCHRRGPVPGDAMGQEQQRRSGSGPQDSANGTGRGSAHLSHGEL